MTKEAFTYALRQLELPAGKWLWLRGKAWAAEGDVYTPLHDDASAISGRRRLVYSSLDEIKIAYDVVLVNCPQSLDETEGLLALALQKARQAVVAVAANDAGGNRLLNIMKAFGVEAHGAAKSGCKIVWTSNPASAAATKIKRSLEKLSLQKHAMDGRDWWTVPGLFGWNKIDAGSQLLAQHLPTTLAGKAVDIGCGYGYLAARLEACAKITHIDAFDVDARAIAATQKNTGEKVHTHWQDIRAWESPAQYDVVVMNPPFHSGKATDVTLGEQCLAKAWASLKTGGQLWMVANRGLPYERALPQLKMVAEEQGFKVMKAQK